MSAELNMRVTQARTDELLRRAATLRRAGSTSGTTVRAAAVVPLTIRFADSLDANSLLTLAVVDSAEPLQLPALVADVEGELRAALSLVDGAVIADPFRPTVELVELLCTRAEQLAAEPRHGLRARLRRPLRAARALRLELRSLGSGGH
jgi:hypothetical protein